jgi:periplasmic divalent cation tolerance protein
MDADILVVITTFPDQDTAEHTARRLIEGQFAACVSILSPCSSIYRWQGVLETSAEVPMMIKTTRRAYPRLEQRLRECHPYELPEILAIPAVNGLPDYLQWIVGETD